MPRSAADSKVTNGPAAGTRQGKAQQLTQVGGLPRATKEDVRDGEPVNAVRGADVVERSSQSGADPHGRVSCTNKQTTQKM